MHQFPSLGLLLPRDFKGRLQVLGAAGKVFQLEQLLG